MRKRLTVLILVALIGAGCGTTKTVVVVATPTPQAETTPTPTPLPRPTPTPKPSKVVAANGDFTDSSGFEVRLTKPTINSGQGEDYGVDYTAGQTWQLFYVIVTNHSSHLVQFNDAGFNLIDQKGQTWSESDPSRSQFQPTIPLVAVPPGSTRAGWMGFQIPVSTMTAQITWDDNGNFYNNPATVGTYRIQ
jgi:Domain of unknown function (DUF4352)